MSPVPLTLDRKERVEAMMTEGCSKREICRTLGLHWSMFEKYWPEYRGFTPQQSIEYSHMRREENARWNRYN